MTENIFNDRPRKNEKQESINYVKSLIEQARTDARDSDIPKLEKLVQLLNSKKYGLVWEEHAELVEEEMKTKIPVFVEVESNKIHDNPESEDFNFLLEGDNLHSLHLLEKTHAGKIDVIYIDPPYNTGNKDFKYNDDFVDSEDTFRHSKWLSFMERRLRIAQKLLSPNGIIFISIDNKEGYQLKLLLDEIFGEEQMAADLHVETSAVAGPRRFAAVNGSVVKTAEFIFVYSNGNKAIMKRPMYDRISGFDTHYSLFEDHESGIITPLVNEINKNEKLVAQFTNSGLKVNMPSLNKLIQVNPVIKEWLYQENISKHIFRLGDAIKLTDDEISQLTPNSVTYLNGKYITLNGKGKPTVLFRYFDRLGISDDYAPEYGERTIRGNLWKGFSADGGNLASEGGVKFKNGKKPKRLIKQLIKSSTVPDSKKVKILDFFAGSGTTGQAVMELNDEGAGSYQFILATNDEVVETTYQRMKNVSADFPLNMKYLKTDFVIKESFPDVSLEYELLRYITPLVELEFAVDIANPKVQIVITDEQFETLIKNNKLVAHSTLFMHPDIFRDAEQNQILSDLQIKVQEIPNYFFGMELWSK
ncbi:site-specific DNA-methyltransferase [Pseudolactococcus raffinolactis]|uniref:site-specific DNA-methyltransferase n=1 Tax=Pseudolactococcus raffinolactis TaxID=1366 RepID=UPI0014373137|nr:site-specific DNA-methyltransferase [Lactococcus raffinolactis]QIW56890.1 site-specific DNA-methyltransferase [Lactococcus raffinolactis]